MALGLLTGTRFFGFFWLFLASSFDYVGLNTSVFAVADPSPCSDDSCRSRHPATSRALLVLGVVDPDVARTDQSRLLINLLWRWQKWLRPTSSSGIGAGLIFIAPPRQSIDLQRAAKMPCDEWILNLE